MHRHLLFIVFTHVFAFNTILYSWLEGLRLWSLPYHPKLKNKKRKTKFVLSFSIRFHKPNMVSQHVLNKSNFLRLGQSGTVNAEEECLKFDNVIYRFFLQHVTFLFCMKCNRNWFTIWLFKQSKCLHFDQTYTSMAYFGYRKWELWWWWMG